MSANLAYNYDDSYGDAATTSVFARPVWRSVPVQPPRVRDYSISSGQVIPIDEPFRRLRIEVIDPSDADVNLLNEIARSINELLSLSVGWDTYGGLPTTEAAARVAINILSSLVSQGARLPTVVPTSNGGVQLEWHNSGWDVEIEVNADGRISTFIDSDAITHSWTNHQLPQDERFREALQTVTAAPAE